MTQTYETGEPLTDRFQGTKTCERYVTVRSTSVSIPGDNRRHVDAPESTGRKLSRKY